MHDEAGFLAAIRQTPADDTTRLVFADWLDEQEDETSRKKAAFIRLELQTCAGTEGSLDHTLAREQLRSLACDLAHPWLAIICRVRIESCRQSERFACPGFWHLLDPMSFDEIRRCGECKRHTRFCVTVADARQLARDGVSVAVSPAVARRPHDLASSPEWVPALQSHVHGRPRPKRKKGRHRQRNIQRGEWEEPE